MLFAKLPDFAVDPSLDGQVRCSLLRTSHSKLEGSAVGSPLRSEPTAELFYESAQI